MGKLRPKLQDLNLRLASESLLLSGLQMMCIGEGRTSGVGRQLPLIPGMVSPGCGVWTDGWTWEHRALESRVGALPEKVWTPAEG